MMLFWELQADLGILPQDKRYLEGQKNREKGRNIGTEK
jgi:hypothetical protein